MTGPSVSQHHRTSSSAHSHNHYEALVPWGTPVFERSQSYSETMDPQYQRVLSAKVADVLTKVAGLTLEVSEEEDAQERGDTSESLSSSSCMEATVPPPPSS